MTPKPHERLKAALDARRADLGLSLREVAEAADISIETLRAIRRGDNRPSMLTKRGIERALQWSAGSIDRILAGGEPMLAVTGTANATLPGPTASAAGQVNLEARGYRSDIPSDEELRRAGLQPETVEAIGAMRDRIARWIAERDESQIRRAERVTEALDADRETG